ncbi:hypothetical protein GQ44DRAFT_724569 [Phaeosphaeriaceae sp. PMI808]|nr:hypothetical protein GQ44DRAFT_724569 [Phaeosphaeriaceae sp. PMI808]
MGLLAYATSIDQFDQEVDTRLPYRVGWPKLPVLPVEAENSSKLFSQELRSHVSEILHTHQIAGTIQPAYRFNRGQEGKLTLVIVVHDGLGMDHSSWPAALKDIHVLNKGLDKDSCRPTVVLTARDASSLSWWDNTLPKLRRQIPKGLEIELLFGDNIFNVTWTEDETWTSTMASYDASKILMGSSCGVSGTKGSRTLRGSLKLEGYNKAKADQTTINAFDRRAGKVFASSGFRSAIYDEDTRGMKDDNNQPLEWALDWCLVAPKPEGSRHVDNTVQGSTARMPLTEGALVDHYCKLNVTTDIDIAKKGRTTDWTTGKINPVASVLKKKTLFLNSKTLSILKGIAIHPLDDFKARDGSKAYGRPVLCYVVVATGRSKLLMMLGDSGSFVLSNEAREQARLLGLAFGSNSASLVAYMTPMRVVAKDIKYVTGHDLEYPSFAGDINE